MRCADFCSHLFQALGLLRFEQAANDSALAYPTISIWEIGTLEFARLLQTDFFRVAFFQFQ